MTETETDRPVISGRLMRSVGHELRNRLGVMKNSTYYLGMKLQDQDEKIRKHIKLFQDEINTMDKIITDLMDFAWVKRTVLADADLNAILRESMAAASLPSDVDVSLELSDDLPPVRVDVDQMQRVLSNVLQLAGQALGQGHRLTVRTRRNGGYIEATLDNSTSSPPASDPQAVFDPLQLTMSRGIGLAMAVSRKLVEGQGGEISVESGEGGFRYVLRLPVGGGA